MFGLSPFELVVVGVVALLLFGSKLPEVARSLGGSYRELRKGLSEFQDQMRLAELNAPVKNKRQPAYEQNEDEKDFVEPSAPKFIPPVRRDDQEV